uniref:DUF4806 domain-containing protein n=1 Tax=Anopheles darlingi TaxID=43151 RepID=A0A2M4CJ80_ANODA
MFLVVETVNDNGEKEWKVAPKRWVCITKNTRRTVLLWPHEINSVWQNHLAKEGVCRPMKSWSRKVCVVNQEFPTYDAADAFMKVLMAEPSSSRASMQLPDEPSEIHSHFEIQQAEADPLDTTMLATIKDMVASLMKRSARVEKQNARIAKQNNILMSKMHEMEEMLIKAGIIEKKKSDFHFNPTKTHDELKQLENKLSDDAFRLKMVEWLEINVVERESEKRLACCLDLLMAQELRTKCTWAGIQRKPTDQTLGIRELPNLKHLFKTIGSTPTEIITDKKLSKFLKNKLRNAKRRLVSNRYNRLTMAISSVPANDNDVSESIDKES